MPQWRKLHVKITDSMDFNDMPDDFTRLTWCLLTLKVCKEGRGIDMPQWIKAQLYPLRSDVTLEQVESAVGWFHERGMIDRYRVNGRPYFQIINWHDYQSTNREAKSSFPSLDESILADDNKEEDKDIDKDKDKDACQMSSSRATHELVVSGKNKTTTNEFVPPKFSSPNGQDKPKKPLTEYQKTLKRLEETFLSASNMEPPNRKTETEKRQAGALWTTPLYREIYERLADRDIDLAEKLILDTVKQMRDNKLTIKAPKSIIGIAADIKAQINQEQKSDDYWVRASAAGGGVF